MINLYIDFDGVILDTIPILDKILEEEGLLDGPQDKISKFLSTLDWEELLKADLILNDSIECIKKIKDSNKFNLVILTHVNSVEESVAKINYIRQYFNDITVIPCPKAISKTKIVQTKDAILVDDYHVNLIEWEEEGGIGIRFSTKLSSKGFKVIDKLDQIIDMF